MRLLRIAGHLRLGRTDELISPRLGGPQPLSEIPKRHALVALHAKGHAGTKGGSGGYDGVSLSPQFCRSAKGDLGILARRNCLTGRLERLPEAGRGGKSIGSHAGQHRDTRTGMARQTYSHACTVRIVQG
jgi:hypothetical protein